MGRVVVEEEARSAPSPRLWHNRDYRLLWTGQVLSSVGTEFGLLAYPLLVLALTRSAVLAGAVGTASAAASFAVRLPAGALADRLNRRKTMIVCDGLRAAVLAGLAVGVALHGVSWPVVLGAAVLDRVGDTLFSPASTAAIPVIVRDDQLEAAWAGVEGRQFAAGIAGPPLGGILYGLGRAIPFVGDAFSYAISVLSSVGLRGDFSPLSGERKGLWREAVEGLRFIWNDRLLRAVVTHAPLINFALSGILYSLVIGLRVNGVSATVIGLSEAVISIGGILGAIMASRLQKRAGFYLLLVLLTLGGSLFMGLASFILPSPLAVIPLAVPVVLSPAANAGLFAALFRRTPKELQGRVNNSLLQLATGLAALAPLLAGVVVESLSASWAMGIFAAVLALSGVGIVVTPALRQVSAEASRTPA